MAHPYRLLAWSLLILWIVPAPASAQEQYPRLGYAYPAGGRQGTSFQVTVGGQYLNDVGRITFSGNGVSAKLIEGIKPMTEMDIKVLRDRLTELAKNQKDPEVRREMAAIQRRISRYMAASLRRQLQPAISETVAIEVTIDTGVEPGTRELRFETARGISNPLRFQVGRLPEFREQEPELVTDFQDSYNIARFPATVTTDISLPATVNGQIIPREPDAIRWNGGFTPSDADRYRFQARKGQTVVIAAAARQLIPYLPDAVPGWFQATLTLYDDQGRELAFADDWRFDPDPVLVFEVPADGSYVVEIKDSISRGRPDFVYRITLGELPLITGIFPLGGRVGEKTSVELTGYNLPKNKLTLSGKEPEVRPVSVRQGDLCSNDRPFAFDSLRECLEKEPNGADAPQAIGLPTIVNGRIGEPGDLDVFRIEGKAGEQIIVEVEARRLDSPLDSVLEVTDAAGKRLAFNDDHDDKADALHTRQADSYLSLALPADGTYTVRLGDAQHQGGPELAYRLRISRPRPDFALRVVPSCINASSWRMTPVTVFALRKDGFDGPIALSLKDNPVGVVMTGGVVPTGQDRVRLTLSLAPWAAIEPLILRMEGRAVIGDGEVVHPAVAADDMMQAFFYKHLVPAGELKVVLADSGRFRPGATVRELPPPDRRTHQSPSSVVSQEPTRIPAGGTAQIQLRGPWSSGQSEMELELSDPPAGIVLDKVAWQDRAVTVTVHSDAAEAKPGLRGNLILNSFRRRTETNKEGKTREYRSFMGVLPAIAFEVVER
ncbi:MAG: PPC domain-containing protein [Thermoguttaceae bacterium]